ncbi:GNAT family N-acetyltransferase [Miniphocaeibacter massiliensis]|uniref:GNAT family N-acetyltransferase n=1 Tax=Miniphocaeibacter massiliensis TaxID=2041841 RepID=UPI000C1C2C5F|nr:GNAT family N-acetyltransferase [Miniphocaeibacter massiliensis]
MDIEIRECKVEDVESIYNLNKNSLDCDFNKDIIKENLEKIIENKNYKILVATYYREVVGYIQAHDYTSLYQESLTDIIGLAVDKRYQGKCIGKRLVQSIEEWAIEEGSKGLRLVTRIDRESAHEFYKKKGFEEIKLQKNFKKYF